MTHCPTGSASSWPYFGKSAQIAGVLEPYAAFRKQFLMRLADIEHGDPEAYAERLATWEAWEGVSNTAMGEPKKTMTGWIEQLAQATQVRP